MLDVSQDEELTSLELVVERAVKPLLSSPIVPLVAAEIVH